MISEDQVEKALQWVHNHIISEKSFGMRPKVLGTRIFDIYTTSNAESEHSAFKRSSVGVKANDSMTTLAQKSIKFSTKRSNERTYLQAKDLECIDTTSQCLLSYYLVKKCFNEIAERLELAKKCISMQTSKTKWTVYYSRPNKMHHKLHMHYLPTIRRKRTVTLTSSKLFDLS